MNIKLKLTADDIKQIIANHLMDKGYVVETGEIVFETGTEVHGCGSDARDIAVFKGCDININIGILEIVTQKVPVYRDDSELFSKFLRNWDGVTLAKFNDHEVVFRAPKGVKNE